MRDLLLIISSIHSKGACVFYPNQTNKANMKKGSKWKQQGRWPYWNKDSPRVHNINHFWQSKKQMFQQQQQKDRQQHRPQCRTFTDISTPLPHQKLQQQQKTNQLTKRHTWGVGCYTNIKRKISLTKIKSLVSTLRATKKKLRLS